MGSTPAAQRHAAPQGWLESAFSVVTMLVFFTALTLVPVALLVSAYYAVVHRSPVGAAVLAALLAATVFPTDLHTRPAFLMDTSNWLWRVWERYFEFEAIVEHEHKLQPDQPYMWAVAPHGTFPMAQWLWQAHYRVSHRRLNRLTKGLGASVLFKLPLWRQLYAWHGVVPADRPSIRKQLDAGYNVCLIPGGIAEMMLSDPEQEVVFLKRRFGFIKVAMATGAHIVPMYCFGQTQLFYRVPFLSDTLMVLARKLRMSTALMYGRWLLPIPFRTKLLTVEGDPIPVERCAQPSLEQVQAVQRQYIDAVVRLFNAHKHHVPGYANKELVVR